MTPKQRAEAELYIAWLQSARDLPPGMPIRADMATFLEQLIRPEQRGRPRVETVLQRYALHHERLPWIQLFEGTQAKLKAQGVRKHFDRALELVAREPGAPAKARLSNWVRRSRRFRGNSRFLPSFADGTVNVDLEPI